MKTFYMITVQALHLPMQPLRKFAFDTEGAWNDFRTRAKAAGWSTARRAPFTTTATAAEAMAELEKAEEEVSA